ncbi:MAG: hypothetical protein PV347_02120 [Rickettsiaceae bacterium]|nr:hypothetical protein [Rickettsiaceae bacterium]MDD9337584.1 hypothetical protein [Rickettsiaceae bacterium]
MPLTKTVMPLTNFSPYLKDGVLDLNKEGNKFSSGKGGKKFTNTFDVRKLAEFIKTTPSITELNAVMWGIGEMPIDEFRLLIKAIDDSNITVLSLGKNTLSREMVEGISRLSKLTELYLDSCNIGDEEITEIVKGLPKILVLNVQDNGITDTGVGAIVKYLPKLLALNASCNRITDLGAKEIADGLNEIKELILPYGNNISCEKLQEIVDVHKTILTKVDLFSSDYTTPGLSKIVALLLPNCVVKLGPHWTRGVNHINDAPFPLDGKVHLYIIKLAEDPPPLIVPVGENNAALPLVEVAGDILQG